MVWTEASYDPSRGFVVHGFHFRVVIESLINVDNIVKMKSPHNISVFFLKHPFKGTSFWFLSMF